MEYNIVVVGGSLVGKSCLVNRFMSGIFLMDYVPTLVDSYRKQATIDRENCLIDISDTSGDELFGGVRESELRKGDGFVCVFSVDSLDSFDQLNDYIKQIQLVKPSNPPILLVGNKCDCTQED